MTAAVADTLSVETLIKAQAYGVGFDLVGITSLGPMLTAGKFDEWIASGYAGEMEYLPRGAAKRRDSRLPFADAISAVVVGLNYGGREQSGPVARYARGDDYHDLMTERLCDLHRWLEREIGRSIAGKAYVDTGPLLERDLARRAGLGWFGKNTNLVSPHLGSFFVIGALVIELELEPDAPFEADRCGRCRKCLDACPTDAFIDERILDARKCISYLTIEARAGIPFGLRDRIGGLVYGCDICQDVCPWNVRFSRELEANALRPREAVGEKDAHALATEVLLMNEESYRSSFRGSPMKRAKLRGLKRNAAVVLGNVGDEEDIALLLASKAESDPLVAEHIDWAIKAIQSRSAAS